MAKNSFRRAPGGKQGFGGGTPPSGFGNIARMAQQAQAQRAAMNPQTVGTPQQMASQAMAQRQAMQPGFSQQMQRNNAAAQQFAPQAPVTTMPVNPNMPVQKGPQFRVPPSGGKNGFGGGAMPQQQMMARQAMAQRAAMPQQSSPQNPARNAALAQALGRFRR